jgi:hypothetical protein
MNRMSVCFCAENYESPCSHEPKVLSNCHTTGNHLYHLYDYYYLRHRRARLSAANQAFTQTVSNSFSFFLQDQKKNRPLSSERCAQGVGVSGTMSKLGAKSWRSTERGWNQRYEPGLFTLFGKLDQFRRGFFYDKNVYKICSISY